MSDVSGKQLAEEYERGEGSWVELGAKYGLNPSTATSRARPYRTTDGRLPMSRGARRRGGEQPATSLPDPVSAQGAPPASASSQDVQPVSGKRVKTPKATPVIGDIQWGELAFLNDCWLDVAGSLKARTKGHHVPELVVVGDVTTGGGVWRGQEMQVALPGTEPQVVYAAWRLMELAEQIGAERVVFVPGNHDKDKGYSHTAFWIVVTLRLFGCDATYHDRRAAVNLAPGGADPYSLLAMHGWGGSSYYANSYSLIRGLWKELLELQETRLHDERIRRVAVGHSHWANVGHHLGGEIFLDTVGGWTRNDRLNLGGTSRPMGALLYRHDGASFTAEKVPPDRGVLNDELRSPHLHSRNMSEIGATLEAATEGLMELELVADGWPSAR